MTKMIIQLLSLILIVSICNLTDSTRFFPSRRISAFYSSGERIYFSAANEDGKRIRYSEGPAFGGMMMSSLTCASCHGADGRGGLHTMHMRVMQAPDIRWNTLSSGEHGEHGENSQEGAEASYDEADFIRVVRDGFAPGGIRLSRDMPRWEMRDEDFRDLILFLETLP